jgi:hypothetical protein
MIDERNLSQEKAEREATSEGRAETGPLARSPSGAPPGATGLRPDAPVPSGSVDSIPTGGQPREPTRGHPISGTPRDAESGQADPGPQPGASRASPDR